MRCYIMIWKEILQSHW